MVRAQQLQSGMSPVDLLVSTTENPPLKDFQNTGKSKVYSTHYMGVYEKKGPPKTDPQIRLKEGPPTSYP